MLSRAAERVYWAGRYLERAENTARIVQKYAHLLLDLPSEVGLDWAELVRIVGAAESFEESGLPDDESAILQFLLADPKAGTSLAFAINMARENIRNLRDLLPHETWENVNELHRFAADNLGQAAAGTDQFEILGNCIERCQQINGTLIGTMSHNSPYHFLTLGQSLERADMTSRVIEVAATYIQQNERIIRRYGSTLWTNVLKSVSGFQMYRQYRQPQVIGIDVVDFLLRDQAFPRAIRFCVENARKSSAALPNSDHVCNALQRVQLELLGSPEDDTSAEDIDDLVDTLQVRLADVHLAIVDTWFLPREE